MPTQTDARDEVLRRAREGARVVLAKHPCVVAGCAGDGGAEFRAGAGRRRTGRQGQQVVGGQDAAGTGGSR